MQLIYEGEILANLNRGEIPHFPAKCSKNEHEWRRRKKNKALENGKLRQKFTLGNYYKDVTWEDPGCDSRRRVEVRVRRHGLLGLISVKTLWP